MGWRVSAIEIGQRALLKKDKALFYHQRILGGLYWGCMYFDPIYKKIGQACVKNMSDLGITTFSTKDNAHYTPSRYIWGGFMNNHQLALWNNAQKR